MYYTSKEYAERYLELLQSGLHEHQISVILALEHTNWRPEDVYRLGKYAQRSGLYLVKTEE